MADTKRVTHRAPRMLSIFAVLIAFVIYFGYGVADLHVPGPQDDEVADAVPAMELIRGLPNTAFDTITIFGLRLPLMMGHYIGPTSIYTSLIGMSVFGTTDAGLRLTELAVGAITLMLLGWFAHKWFGNLIAAISVLLCATAPVFLWWNRAGMNWASPVLPLAIALLALLYGWWQKHQPTYLVLAALVFGIGMTTKLLFAWLVVPIVLTALFIFGVKGSWKSFRILKMSTLALCAIAFSLGFAPFIVHNIPSGASFRFIAENALQSRAYGHNNLDIIANVSFEFADFLRMVGGNTLYFDAPAGLPLGTFAVIATVLYTACVCILNKGAISLASTVVARRSLPYIRWRLFLLITIATVIPLGTISISDIGARHLFIIFPLVCLLIAISICDLPLWFGSKRTKRVTRAIGVAIVVGLTANQTVTNALVSEYFVRTGGAALWSDSLYQLAAKLQTSYSSRPIIALDWGFARSVVFLTQGRLYMKEMHDYLPEPSPQFADVSAVLLRDPTNVYVFHTPAATAFKGYFEVLAQTASRMHKQLVLLSTLTERSGIPNTLIYEGVETPRSFAISSTLALRNATLVGGLSLLGGTVNYEPTKHVVSVILQWQSTVDQLTDDTVLLHIVNQSNGSVVVNGDQQPVYGSYPFSVWQKGEVVIDPHWLTLPVDLTPGIYQVRVGVYDRTTGARRAINDPLNDSAGDSLMLNSFEIK